jgi:hypothetical protein
VAASPLKPCSCGNGNQGFQGSELGRLYQPTSFRRYLGFRDRYFPALGPLDREAPVITVDYPATPFDAYYISPNGDGVQDTVVLPLRITDKRYVQSYALKVYDGTGTLVRTMADAETRPAAGGFRGFLARLRYVKKDVSVPDQLVWDGKADNGQVVADGPYTIVIEAADDNGYTAVTEKFAVMVDTVAPAGGNSRSSRS